MPDRKAFTLADKIIILQRQAICALCGNPLGDGAVHYDHAWALGRGGGNEILNIRAVHPACHKVKTIGNGATTRGSDIGEISKSRRLERVRLHGPKVSKHPMPGAKASGWRRPMRGKAERRG